MSGADSALVPHAAKIIIGGGYGAGKTTFVGAISEITPVTTEALQTGHGVQADSDPYVPGKATTTVAMDFGRVTIAEDLALYLFATPSQQRFWFMWDQLAEGAIGAVVIVDVRRFADCFTALDFFESLRLPTVVAINVFPDAPTYTVADLRDALAVGDDVPVYLCDAPSRDSVKSILIGLSEHAISVRRDEGRPPSETQATAYHRF